MATLGAQSSCSPLGALLRAVISSTPAAFQGPKRMSGLSSESQEASAISRRRPSGTNREAPRTQQCQKLNWQAPNKKSRRAGKGGMDAVQQQTLPATLNAFDIFTQLVLGAKRHPPVDAEEGEVKKSQGFGGVELSAALSYILPGFRYLLFAWILCSSFVLANRQEALLNYVLFMWHCIFMVRARGA